MQLQTLMHCADAMKNFAVVYLVREGESCPPLCRRGAAGAGPGVARWGGALVFELWVFALNLGVCSFSSGVGIRAEFGCVLFLFCVRVCVVRVCVRV